MSTNSKMYDSFQQLQRITSALRSSVPSDISNISAGLAAFANNESIKQLSKQITQFEESGLVVVAKELQSSLSFLPKIDFNSLTVMQDKLEQFAKLDVSSLLTTASCFSAADVTEVLKKNNPQASFDYEHMGIALQQVFSRYSNTSVNESVNPSQPIVSIETIAKEVQEEYTNTETTQEFPSEGIKQSVSDENIRLAKKSITISIASIVITTIFTLLMGVTQIALAILNYRATLPTSDETITETQEFITTRLGIDPAYLNEQNYRMICWDNVMPRIYHDCSSRVTGHLEKGKIVVIVNRYRKWIEIIWQDDTGELHSGWIQNYKVTEFK